MRKLITLTVIVTVLSLIFSACGFGSWQDEEAIRSISEIKRVTDEEGNVYIEISYQDDSPKDRFLLPEGTAISEVTSDYDSEKGVTNVTINYSDGKKPFTFEIPDGVDGASVYSAELIEKNGIKYISFKYRDSFGNELNSIDVNIDELRGEDGSTWHLGEGAPDKNPEKPVEGKVGDFYLDTENFVVYSMVIAGAWTKLGTIKGSGIREINAFMDENGKGGYQIITTDQEVDSSGQPLFDDGGAPIYVSYKVYSQTLNAMEVKYNSQTGMYEFIVSITDVLGNDIKIGAGEDKIQVQRPATWLSGDVPPDLMGGLIPGLESTPTFDGDFYYCKPYNQIWTKSDGVWVKLIDLNASQTSEVSVTFEPEGGQMPVGVNAYPSNHTVNQNGSVTVKMAKGSTYPQSNTIPVPTRDGYTFLGWYRSKDVQFVNGLPINYGAFNDMVPVTQDITLFALWEEIV